MIGYVYNTERKIILKIPNVTGCNDTTITGDMGTPNSSITAVMGTGEYLVTDQDYAEGSTLPIGLTDQRASIPQLE